ncbi:MAG: DKNYY domain-containing protein [Patescibacteria group bacterium]
MQSDPRTSFLHKTLGSRRLIFRDVVLLVVIGSAIAFAYMRGTPTISHEDVSKVWIPFAELLDVSDVMRRDGVRPDTGAQYYRDDSLDSPGQEAIFCDGDEHVRDENRQYPGRPDIATFVAAESGRYGKDKDYVYYCHTGLDYLGPPGMTILADADPRTFTLLTSGYAKDARHTYRGSEIINDSPNTFSVLSEDYAKDADHVYYGVGIGSASQSYNAGTLDGADPRTFSVLSDQYVKDATHVYHHCWQGHSILEGADAQTFEVLNAKYAKDAFRVYLYSCDHSSIVEGSDPQTFTVPVFGYPKDGNHVYNRDKPIPGADPDTFEVLTDAATMFEDKPVYSKDKNNVYADLYNLIDAHQLLGADSTTFTLSGGYPHDKEWVYGNKYGLNGIARLGPTSVLATAYRYATPSGCEPEEMYYGVDTSIPSLFSADGSVIGWRGEYTVCILDTKTASSSIWSIGYPADDHFSRDGSRFYYLYTLVMKGPYGDGDLPPCPKCGWHVIDRKNGTDTRLASVPDDIVFWDTHFGASDGRIQYNRVLDVHMGARLIAEGRKSGSRVVLEVRRLPVDDWDYLTTDKVRALPLVRSFDISQRGYYADVNISQDGRSVDYLYSVGGDIQDNADFIRKGVIRKGRLDIATGKNTFPL